MVTEKERIYKLNKSCEVEKVSGISSSDYSKKLPMVSSRDSPGSKLGKPFITNSGF